MAALENDHQIEAQLNKLQARLEYFSTEGRTMRVGLQKFDINDKDPIFFLNGPIRREVRTGSCTSCRTFIFESKS